MPYIKQKDRFRLADTKCPHTAGELNFMITALLITYWNSEPQNYQRINDIIGACEGAKAEFQRRIVNDYEDSKIKENGDVY